MPQRSTIFDGDVQYPEPEGFIFRNASTVSMEAPTDGLSAGIILPVSGALGREATSSAAAQRRRARLSTAPAHLLAAIGVADDTVNNVSNAAGDKSSTLE